jgi:hypothetical protein
MKNVSESLENYSLETLLADCRARQIADMLNIVRAGQKKLNFLKLIYIFNAIENKISSRLFCINQHLILKLIQKSKEIWKCHNVTHVQLL